MRPALAGALTAALAVTGLLALAPRALMDRDIGSAARMAPWDNSVQRRAAYRALRAEQPQRSARFGRRALVAMPYDQFALAAAMLDQPAAPRLAGLNIAAGLGWRDTPTNLALFEAAVAENRPDIAAQRVDAIGRLQGGAGVAPLADRLLDLEGGTAQLAGRARALGGSGWWEDYFRTAPATDDAALHRAALARALRTEDETTRRRILSDVSTGLATGGFGAIGYGLWRDSLAPDAPFAGAIYDPDFALFDPGRVAVGGEWDQPGRSPAIVARRKGGGVTIEPTGGSGTVLQQNLRLSAGNWRLSVREEGNVSGWRLACEDGGPLPLEPTANGTSAERRWTVRVPEGCAIAHLSLITTGSGLSTGSAQTPAQTSPSAVDRVTLEKIR